MRRLALVVCVCAAAALTGCDSGNDDASTTLDSPGVPQADLGTCLVGTWELDAGFMQTAIEQSVTDPDVTMSDVVFGATQTATLSSDETFSAEVVVTLSARVSTLGQTVPVVMSGRSTVSGTWQNDDDAVWVTVGDHASSSTMTADGLEVEAPSMDGLLLLPDEPTPVVCADEIATLDVPGMSAMIPGAPDELVLTRR